MKMKQVQVSTAEEADALSVEITRRTSTGASTPNLHPQNTLEACFKRLQEAFNLQCFL
jgi:hypothetical protein